MDALNVQDGWMKQYLENKQAKTCVLLAAWQRERVLYTEAVRCTWLQIPAALVTNEMSFYLILLKCVPSLQPSFQDQMKQSLKSRLYLAP